MGDDYKQPNIFGSRRGDQDRTSETVFIKIKGISPLKGIKKSALEGALNGGALSTALQAHVYRDKVEDNNSGKGGSVTA